jgi:hypothetical protein
MWRIAKARLRHRIFAFVTNRAFRNDFEKKYGVRVAGEESRKTSVFDALTMLKKLAPHSFRHTVRYTNWVVAYEKLSVIKLTPLIIGLPCQLAEKDVKWLACYLYYRSIFSRFFKLRIYATVENVDRISRFASARQLALMERLGGSDMDILALKGRLVELDQLLADASEAA